MLALLLAAAACSGSDSADDASDGNPSDEGASGDDVSAATQTTVNVVPGAGIDVAMARAPEPSGHFVSGVYQRLLAELGYRVSDPADQELGPSDAYRAMATGELDFWANGWAPGHEQWLEGHLEDDTRLGDNISVVGEAVTAGGVQGYLATASFASQFGLQTVDDLNNNGEALAALDAVDHVPNNGLADIYSCQESWTCGDIVASQIAFSGWRNIAPVIIGYDAQVEAAVAKANTDVPMVIYTWAPSPHLARLTPGENVVWLGVEQVLDNSNPLGLVGGARLDQRPGVAPFDAGQCPIAATVGSCQLGWSSPNMTVVANNEFLAANPSAASLLAVVNIPLIDMAQADLERESDGISAAESAANWITQNRNLADTWLEAARIAG